MLQATSVHSGNYFSIYEHNIKQYVYFIQSCAGAHGSHWSKSYYNQGCWGSNIFVVCRTSLFRLLKKKTNNVQQLC